MYNDRIKAGIYETAISLGMDPVDLATIISYETAGTFNPRAKGPTTKWGQHEGFIQFGQPQQQEHGVDWNDPIGSQLGPGKAVESYFRSSGWKPGMGILDAYSIVNAGGPGRYGASDTAAGGAPGNVYDKVTQQFGPHREKAMALLGMSSRGGSDMIGTPFAPPTPERKGVIQQLMGGNFRGAGQSLANGMFNPDGSGGPLQQVDQYSKQAQRLAEIAALQGQTMADSRAPVSWTQVLAGGLGTLGANMADNRAAQEQGDISAQLSQLMSTGDLTPETIAQIAQLDPRLGQQLMVNQVQYGQQTERDELAYARDLDMQQLKFEQDNILQQMEPETKTALMQNLEAAGYVLGTPEYSEAMREQLAADPTGPQLIVEPGGKIIFNPNGGGLPAPVLQVPGVGGLAVPGQIGQTPLPPVDVPYPPGGVLPGENPNPPVGVAPVGPGSNLGPVGPVGPDPSLGPVGPVVPGVPGAALPPVSSDVPGATGQPGVVVGLGKPGEGRVQTVTPEDGLTEQAIPGSKVYEEQKTEYYKKNSAKIQEWAAGDAVLRAIESSLLQADKYGSTGMGRILPELIGSFIYDETDKAASGTAARAMDAELSPILANIGFDQLNKMRQNSPTGGALGQVTERELGFLQSVIASLDPGAPETMKRGLKRVKEVYRAMMTGENYEKVMGFPPPAGYVFGPETIGGPASMPQPPGPPDKEVILEQDGPFQVIKKVPQIGEKQIINGEEATWNGQRWIHGDSNPVPNGGAY